MKNLISLTELNKTEISQILEVAQQMRRIVTANYKRGPQLIGSVVAGVWPKPCLSSTAFSLATSYLSGTPCPFYNVDDIMSCCKMLENMGANTIVVSCENDNLAKTFASTSKKSVINGGSGQYDPIGVLADMLALSIRCDGLHNLSILAVGNRDTNKINEYNHCLALFGGEMIWYLPVEDLATQRKGIVLDDINSAFAGVDAVVDLGLSAFSEPQRYYGANGGISQRLMDKARIDCLLLGSRNVVVDNVGVKPYQHSLADLRETCYISVAMAVLYLMHRD